MPSDMETIHERLALLENILGPVAGKKNQSVNDRLAYAVEMAETAAG
jgi:hypothetical protein